MGAVDQKSYDRIKKRLARAVDDRVTVVLRAVCVRLVNDALSKQGYKNFTGNTVTSLTCGLFVGGRLRYMVSSGESMAKPVRRKISNGKYVFLDPDYDGEARGIKGSVATNGGYGESTAKSFLRSYSPSTTTGYEIVMTTGTEYSTYIETMRNLNVLTETFQTARDVLMSTVRSV